MQYLSRRAPLGDRILIAEPGQTLFWEGDPCSHVIEVLSGIVRGVSLSEEGERQVTAFFFTGDQIGIPVRETYRYSAEPVTSVSYIRQPQVQWCEAVADSLRAEGCLLQSIGDEQDPIFRRGMLIGRSGAVSRMAAFLVAIIDRLEPFGPALRFPLPQIDIAAYLALTPETVCRSLKQLRRSGLIEMHSHDQLIVLDRRQLELAAHIPLPRQSF